MENSSFDVFGLCWHGVLGESINHKTFFSEKHCLEDDCRDRNFDLVENRLAYAYKFGYFNTSLVQKCLEHFLGNYSEGKMLFSSNLKVCSLSNGPGFDLLGLLCTIDKLNRNVKNFPVFTAINLYSSWRDICYEILLLVYEAAYEPFVNNYNILPEIVNFTQCDIYSTISSEAKESIKYSDILLMVNVFASAKATSEVAKKSMKEIFSLLKTGSFVFFVGSKKNTKELTENNFQSEFVNCVLGPVKISVADLPLNEFILGNVKFVKPKTSGHAYFVVWQKKDSISLDTPEKGRGKKKEKKSTIQIHKGLIENIALSQQTGNSDESSEMPHSSSVSISHDSSSKPLNLALTTSQPTISLDNTPKKKKSKRKKMKSTKSTIQIQKEFIENPSVSKQPTNDTDAISETLCSSHSKQSKSSSDFLSNLCDFLSTSSGKISESSFSVEIHSPHLGKEEHHLTLKKSLSLNNITALPPFKATIQVQKEFVESTAFSKQADNINESSNSEQSRSLSTDFLSVSSGKISKSNSPVEIYSPHLGNEEHNITLKKSLSVNTITALLNEVHLDSEIRNLTINDNKSGKESICIPEQISYAKEFESLVKEEIITQNQNENDLLNAKKDLNRVSCKSESEIIQSNFCEKANKETLLTHYMNDSQNAIQKSGLPIEENSVLILNNIDVPVNSCIQKGSVKAAQFNTIVSSNVIPILKNVQVKKNHTSVLTQTDNCLPNNFQKNISIKTAEQNIDYLGLKESNNYNLSSKENSKKEEKVLRTVIQNRHDKNSFLDLNSKSESKISEDKSCENSLDLNSDVFKERTPKIDKNKDLNLFLQRCENLVTSLEKLTDNIKNTISSSCDQDIRCYYKKSCTNFKIQHAHMNTCCFNAVHSHCCIAYNCHMFPHTSTCRKHFCERAEQK